MRRGDCTRETLARGPACTVEVCGCGSLHMTLGAVTLRFTPDAADSLMKTLAEAIERLGLRNDGLVGRKEVKPGTLPS